MVISKLNVISGIVVGALGIAGPIAWDYYKTKADVDLRPTSSSVIIAKLEKLDGLVVTYNGEELDELSKTIFVIGNSGRTPIRKEDFVQPIQVKFSPQSGVIAAQIEATKPKNLDAKIEFKKTDSTIIFDIPLLNPGDQIEFSALAKSAKIDFDASARIAGINALTVSKEIEKDRLARATPWTVYPVGFFSLATLLLAMFGLFSHVPSEIRFRRRIKKGTFDLPAMNSLAECQRWIDSKLFFLTLSERARLKAYVTEFQDTQNFSSIYGSQLITYLQTHHGDKISNLAAVLLLVFISTLGWLYVFYNL